MPDRETPEGWGVRQRIAVLAALGTVVTLLLLLLGAGILYNRTLRPKTFQTPVLFPAPGLETPIHDGAGDPHRPAATAPRDPALTAAKQRVIKNGLSGWERP